MDIQISLLAKTLAVLFLALISPGPDFVMVLRNSLTYGRQAGLLAALGIASGCLLSFSLVMAGIQILFRFPVIKLGLSIICGAYLIYIGLQCLKSKSQHTHINSQHRQHLPWLTYYRNGLFTNLFNPKLYSLGTAILAYTEQQQPTLATNFTILIGQALMALVWFVCVSLVFSYSQIQDAYLRRERRINLLLGLVFIGIGARVMLG